MPPPGFESGMVPGVLEDLPAPVDAERRPVQPAGAGDYCVRQGECLASIAVRTGHFWRTLWEHPSNTGLRQIRQNSTVLLPGDRLVIPPIESKSLSAATDQRHRFIRRGRPAMLRLRLLRENQPRANLPYRLMVDGQAPRSGQTDQAGHLDEPIPADAERGRLVLDLGAGLTEEVLIAFGHLDPVSELTGVKARLQHLGFPTGDFNDQLNADTREALRAFQRQCGLAESGEPDQATRDRLHREHKS